MSRRSGYRVADKDIRAFTPVFDGLCATQRLLEHVPIQLDRDVLQRARRSAVVAMEADAQHDQADAGEVGEAGPLLQHQGADDDRGCRQQ
jgi:hypothetical protein